MKNQKRKIKNIDGGIVTNQNNTIISYKKKYLKDKRYCEHCSKKEGKDVMMDSPVILEDSDIWQCPICKKIKQIWNHGD